MVGESGSAQGAAAEILRLDADVMLLDGQLEDGSGIEVCRAVRSVKPIARGLLLTAAGDEVASAAAVLAGATGYLVKVTRGNDIVGAVRNERTGTSHLDASSIQRAADVLRSVMESLTPPATEDERQLLAHVLDGRTDSEIAEAWATGNGRRGPDIVAFVARMTRALLGRATAPRRLQ